VKPISIPAESLFASLWCCARGKPVLSGKLPSSARFNMMIGARRWKAISKRLLARSNISIVFNVLVACAPGRVSRSVNRPNDVGLISATEEVLAVFQDQGDDCRDSLESAVT
jgi:hypothetical protein